MRVVSDRGKEIIERKAKDKAELRKIKFNDALTQDLDTAIYVYGNKLAMITATERERGGMIIENKEIATIFKRLFGIIWEKAKD